MKKLTLAQMRALLKVAEANYWPDLDTEELQAAMKKLRDGLRWRTVHIQRQRRARHLTGNHV